ncbi:MAG: hypothetical protein ACRDTE_23305 [Pseudonocardiaceae bacterium]
MDELHLHLDGPANGIDARALREGLDNLLTLINSVTDAEDEPAPDLWLLADLSLSSVNCAVIPPLRSKHVAECGWTPYGPGWNISRDHLACRKPGQN